MYLFSPENNVGEWIRPQFADVNKTCPAFPGEGIFSMAKKLYVGNLSYNTTEDGLRNLFSQFGTVASAKIIFDRDTGNSKGFGFIELETDEEAAAAIAGTNGRELEGRQIRVNEAMEKAQGERRSRRDNW
jgi:RNA recognition motif-containing protein